MQEKGRKTACFRLLRFTRVGDCQTTKVLETFVVLSAIICENNLRDLREIFPTHKMMHCCVRNADKTAFFPEN